MSEDGTPRPSAAPPAWAPWAWFIALTSVVATVVVMVVHSPGLLDDPQRWRQRSGVLFDGPRVDDLVGRGRRTVVLFLRQTPAPERLAAWREKLPADVRVLVVTPDPLGGAPASDRVRRALQMPRPRDRGFPIGYAIVDVDGQLRYATLDPLWDDNAGDVRTLLNAVPKPAPAGSP